MLESPFGSIYETVCARFKFMNAPLFPMAGLLVFWAGIQNGIWNINFSQREYEKKSPPGIAYAGFTG
jgi:uncharacterized protein